MHSIEQLNDRRAELESELSKVRQEIAARHGQVDDPSDRPDNIPVPGHDKASPPPDPRPDPEIDPETGMAVEDIEDSKPQQRTQTPQKATASTASTSTKATK